MNFLSKSETAFFYPLFNVCHLGKSMKTGTKVMGIQQKNE